MSKIIDLGTIVKEPLVFQNCPDGKTYNIPGGISTEFVLQIQKMQTDLNGLTEGESVDKLFDILVIILNLDKEKNVDKEYVKMHFDNIRLINAIVNSVMEHINEIANDPN
ncbi:hypothetical protein [Clostridium sp. UBA5988]|uniref:hypothetical protein n=1 Tax=Clostridium sp. UBA5988 TaxID=1946369 RepID=UPI003216314A